MTMNALADVGIRLLGLWLGATAVQGFPYLSELVTFSAQGPIESISSSLLWVLVQAAVVGFLIFRGDIVAGWLFSPESESSPLGKEGLALSARDGLYVSIVVLGLFLVSTHISSILFLLLAVWAGNSYQSELVDTVATAAIGLGFMFRAKSVAHMVGWRSDHEEPVDS